MTLPAPQFDSSAKSAPNLQTVVLAGGCFWGVQAVFQHTRGVVDAVSGYAGGTRESANYDSVSSGATAHAEAVQIKFNPQQVSLGKLLQIYFSVAHNPTELNRQGPDTGKQYRSAVFYTEPSQQEVTQRYIAQLNNTQIFSRPIVTQLNKLDAFFPAEAYHQNYATLHPDQGYIARFDLPKIRALKTLFPDLYRDVPVLTGAVAKAGRP